MRATFLALILTVLSIPLPAGAEQRASPLGPPRGLQEIIDEVNGAARGMKWLVDFTCGCDRESLAWEALARSRGVPDSILGDLAELRDPEEFGRILYNYPPRFSMLTPKAKLGAWLRFAAAPDASASQIDAALAGARTLDHRTADAVEWLSDPHREGDRFELMRLLPELDLEATPQLCASGLSWVRAQLTRTYRPTQSEPESYRGLEIRLGVGQPLVALQWFSNHGYRSKQTTKILVTDHLAVTQFSAHNAFTKIFTNQFNNLPPQNPIKS